MSDRGVGISSPFISFHGRFVTYGHYGYCNGEESIDETKETAGEMGNCQATDVATLVLQHPNGKEEKLYRSVTAFQIMKMNSGYYVALLISSAIFSSEESLKKSRNPVRLTRVKLLRPSESLLLGQVYRLMNTRDVMNGLREKQAKMKKNQFVKSKENVGDESEGTKRGSEERKEGRNRERKGKSISSAASKSRTWQPSLQSISEAAS